MSESIKLDTIDKNIIRLLQKDASTPIQELAHEVGLTNNPCWRRVKRLEEGGIISRRTIVVDAKRMGLENVAFVSLKTRSHTPEWLADFQACIKQLPEVSECHRMAGEVDYLLKIVIRDLEHYDQVYQSLISQVSDLSDVTATFSMEALKYTIGVDVDAI